MKRLKYLPTCLIFFLLFTVNAFSADSYTKLYLKGEALQDDSGNYQITMVSNFGVSDPGKFGKCLYGGSTSSYISFPASDDWNFGTEDFTIDTWVRISDYDGPNYIFGCQCDESDIGFVLYQENNKLYFKKFLCPEYSHSSSSSLLSGTFYCGGWSHVALVRSGDQIRLYKDGRIIASSIYTDSIRFNPIIHIDGSIDEFRVSKGIARWTQGFTPPEPSPDAIFSASQSAINHGENVTLSWSATDAQSCSISPDIGNVDISGSVQVTLTAPQTYTLTVTGTDGTTTSKQVSIDVASGFSRQGKFTVDGNFGVGVMDPQSALEVNGIVKAREVVVTSTGWADCVFEPGYQLPPLSAVQKYIRRNKHLPEIPSAKHLDKQGIPVSDLLALQMKKIEELTLYVIELETRLKKIEQ